MIKQANRKRRQVTIRVDDWVYLKIRPHRQMTMPIRLHPKLSTRYYRPFKVIQKIGEVAFRLLLPENARIHPIFHVSQLKLAIGTNRVEKELLADLQMSGPSCWPSKVLDKRVQLQEGDQREQVLIEWQNGGVESATWEDRMVMQEQFPKFNLGDKVASQGGSNCRNRNRDGTTIQKEIGFEKRFGVATIVYYGKLRKNHKMIRHSPRKLDFGFGSRLRVGKVLTPYNACPKAVPLTKCTNMMWF
ncbi:hypothetical protein LR48_Vigan583s003400 [Vigna angularis]|uniref:Tf2-1-like SH3-like domain-containing protein n=1 Tax=Phaseolus angularis TaxID=3914 RepID=A0A0L9TE28_PHAAN|nr:hypothetical protein LR48_Vigan583s003400 [Vigna angularis]